MSRAKKAPTAPTPTAETTETVASIKGFSTSWTCRGFQYAPGQTYEMTGPARHCASGFHACDAEAHPLDVFGYYSPAGSRFADVTQGGQISRSDSDSKIASTRITIGAEIHLHELVQRAIRWVFDRSKPEGETATGYQGAASATGDRGAASATGYQGAASATGYQGAASATGDQGAASATGDRGAASATGDRGAVMGMAGCALFLVYRDPDSGEILHAWAGIAGRDGIEPGVWYSLDESGSPVRVEGR